MDSLDIYSLEESNDSNEGKYDEFTGVGHKKRHTNSTYKQLLNAIYRMDSSDFSSSEESVNNKDGKYDELYPISSSHASEIYHTDLTAVRRKHVPFRA